MSPTVLDCLQGGIVAVRHFTDTIRSALVYATQCSAVHAFDMRARVAMWRINVPVEFGYITSMELCLGACAAARGTACVVLVCMQL